MSWAGENTSVLLSGSEQTYFQEMESLFAQPGWGHIIKEIEAEMERIPEETFWRAKSFDDIQLARIRLVELTRLAQYPDAIEMRKTNLLTERRDRFEELQAGAGSYE